MRNAYREIKIGLFHAQSARKLKSTEQTFVSPVFSDDKRIEVEPYQAAQPVFSFVFFLCLISLDRISFLKKKAWK
jgi:hypothetical protein